MAQMQTQLDSPPAGNGDGRITKVERDSAGMLVVHIDGKTEPVVDARVARCFPWSLPDQYISVRTKEGKEVVLLRDLSPLDTSSRQLVEEELRGRIFNPRIQEVVDYKEEFGVTSITARTDRGEVTFQIRSRDDVRVISATRALFRDADGNTYELHDVAALDAASRKKLQQYF